LAPRGRKKTTIENTYSVNSTNHSSDIKVHEDSLAYQIQMNGQPQSQFQRKDKSALKNDSETQGSQEEKKLKYDPQMTFKNYRSNIKEQKRRIKKQSRERQQEIIEKKNSSNDSIKSKTMC